MLNVVFYEPETGKIISCSQTSGRSAVASGQSFIIVDEYRTDYDATHRVADGKLVEGAV